MARLGLASPLLHLTKKALSVRNNLIAIFNLSWVDICINNNVIGKWLQILIGLKTFYFMFIFINLKFFWFLV